MEWLVVPPLTEADQERDGVAIDRWTLAGLFLEQLSSGSDCSVEQVWGYAVRRAMTESVYVLVNGFGQPVGIRPRYGHGGATL